MIDSLLFASAVVAGFLGSLLGLGGGVILIPTMTLLLKIDIRYAIGASLLSIVASSVAGSTNYLKESLVNIRLSVPMELSTVAGAIFGFFISSYIQARFLFFLFGLILIVSALLILRKREGVLAVSDHKQVTALKINHADYKIEGFNLGFFLLFFAGVLSSILGIGSGIFKVLTFDRVLKLPLRVSSATSNFMIGGTASASAIAYFLRGDIEMEIAAPIVVGIFWGSFFGAKAMPLIPLTKLRLLFVLLLFIVGFQMISKGFM